MIVLVQANVLTIGLNGRDEVLKELPIRLVSVSQAKEAVKALRNGDVDSVVGAWDEEGSDNNIFLKKLRHAKPDVPTIVFVAAGDTQQEIDARSLGFSAVLTEDATDEVFKRTIANVLGLHETIEIREIVKHKPAPTKVTTADNRR